MSQDLLSVIHEVSEALKNAADDKKPAITDSLLLIVRKLVKTITAFNDIPDTYMNKLLPAMQAQMKAAEKRTEKAADTFLGIAEQISNSLKDVPEPAKTEIQNKINSIFEASAFQDLVAQHINEIKLLVDDLTYDIESLNGAIRELTSTSEDNIKRTVKMKRSDDHLLNGPPTNF